MSLLADWNDAQAELKDALIKLLKAKTQPPEDAAELLKTAALKEALELADSAKAKGDVDAARKAQGKTQKFFLMYANKFKAAMVATRDEPFLELHETLKMFNVYMTRTQKAVALLTAQLIKEAKEAEQDEAKKLVLDIKAALSPLRFKYDWKAAKEDFEKETSKKKPSEKIMGTFRKSAGLDNALDDMDKACKAADPKDYRKAYESFVKTSADYLKVLKAALAGDKAADEIYKKKCEGLKDVLSSIDGRAKEKITLLDRLEV